MSNPLEFIQPSLRYLREQRELDKVLVVDVPKGADGLGRVDLASGHIKIPVKKAQADAESPETDADAPATTQPDDEADA